MIRIPNGHIILPQDVENLSILSEALVTVVKGQAKAMTSPEMFLDYNGGARVANESGDLKRMSDPKKRVNRGFDDAVCQRVDWAIDHGFLNKDRKDEAKLRFDGHSLKKGVCNPILELRLGPTHWLEHMDTNYRGMQDAAVYGRLTAKGVRNFNEERAYFADAVGVNAVLQNGDGKYFLFLRSKDIHPFWPDRWHNVGGFYGPDFSLFEPQDDDLMPNPKSLKGGPTRTGSKLPADESKDAVIAGARYTVGDSGITSRILSSLAERMEVEIQEELGGRVKLVQLKMIGISYGMSSVDFNYEAKAEFHPLAFGTGKRFKEALPEAAGFSILTFGELIDVLAGKKILSPAGKNYRPCSPKDSSTAPTPFAPTGLAGLLIHVGLKDQDALKSILATPQYQFYG